MRLNRLIPTLVAATLLLTACFESVNDTTSVVIKPLSQATSGALNEPLTAVRAYAFEADTTDWMVRSWEDAIDGVLTSKSGGEQLTTPYAVASAFTPDEGVEGMDNRIVMSLPPREMMMLVVDEQHRLYAYNNIETAEGMPSLYITLIFKPWKEMTAYKEGWSFYNPFFTPKTELETFIDVTAQEAEGGPLSTIASAKVYAFAADTTEWRIASYDDAAGGVLTSKLQTGVERDTPEYNGYQTNEKSIYRMVVDEPKLMIVVVDRTHERYAYTQQTVDLEGESPLFEVVFPLWEELWQSDRDGWHLVNPAYAPTQETTDEQTNQ